MTFLIFYGITTSNAQDADFVVVTAGYLNTTDRTSIEGQSENFTNLNIGLSFGVGYDILKI